MSGIEEGGEGLVALSTLRRVVAGDLAMMKDLAGYSHGELLAASEGSALVVTKVGPHSIVLALLDGTASPEAVRAWASFVRRGYLGGHSGPIQPLAIEYDGGDEDVIVEVVSRLDEIGDLIDGVIEASELRMMLQALGAGTDS